MHAPSRSSTLTIALIAAASLTMLGCKQGEGDICEVTSDCAFGLTCCDSDLPRRRGICMPEGMCSVRDAGVRADAGPQDASTSDAGPSDAGTDAGPSDAGTDGGPGDAGTDAGAMDTGTDAGASDAGDGT